MPNIANFIRISGIKTIGGIRMEDTSRPHGIRKYKDGLYRTVLPGVSNVMAPDHLTNRQLDRYVAQRSGPVITYRRGQNDDTKTGA